MRAIFIALVAASLMAAQSQSDRLAAAREAEQAGRLADAERQYEQALAISPSAEVWQRLGLVRHLQDKFEQAVPAFAKAIAVDPKLWGSHLFLGIALYRTNQFGRARESLERANTLQSRHPEVQFWLGATNLALGRYLAGLQLLEQRLAVDPKNAEVLQLLASAYREYGISLWNAVAENHFDTVPGQMVHGHALAAQGALDDALIAYRKAAAIDPERPGVRSAINEILVRQGK